MTYFRLQTTSVLSEAPTTEKLSMGTNENNLSVTDQTQFKTFTGWILVYTKNLVYAYAYVSILSKKF